MTKYVRADMPINHFPDHSKDFITLKARQPDEIERRRQLQPGSIRLAMQYKGAVMLGYVLGQLSGDALSEGLQVAGKGLFGSAYYSSARGSRDVMRRDLDVPVMFDEETDMFTTHQQVLAAALGGLATAERLTDRQYRANEQRNTQRFKYEHQLGRVLGNTAMLCACVDLASSVESLSPADAQEVARTECLTLMLRTAQEGAQAGAYPSLTQFAEPLSPWSRHLRLAADSNEFVSAYEAALDGAYIGG